MTSDRKSSFASCDSTASLFVSQLRCAYRSHLVLDDVSFTATPGNLLVLLGGNGAGKSTLLNALAGLIPVRKGDVTLGSESLLRLSVRERAKLLSLMPQFESKEVMLSVHQVVSLGRSPHQGWMRRMNAEDEAIIQQALDAVGLLTLADRAVWSLSGGEWRRMMLARALVQRAKVMLLDEPTEGLDLRYQHECLEQVRRIVKQEDVIAIVTLHDLNQAAMYADHIGILANNRLVAFGEPHEVLTRELIEKTYGVDVDIMTHPRTGKPFVLPVPGMK